MTVKELMELLETVPPEAVVRIRISDRQEPLRTVDYVRPLVVSPDTRVHSYLNLGH